MTGSAPARVVDQPAPPARVTPEGAIRAVLERYKPVIAKLLAGTGVSEETFLAWTANACRATPKLWECVPETVLGAALRCAQIGLAPNDGRNLCWLIPRKDKNLGGRLAAHFQLGYGGVLELARRAAPGVRFEGRIVYPNDVFDPGWSDDKPFRHVPYLARGKDRGGDARAWYVVATWPDGGRQVQIVDRDEVERRRAFSSAPDSDMWTRSYDSAALKTAVLAMGRWLPATPQLGRAQQLADGLHDVRDMEEVSPAELAELEAAPEPDDPPPEPTP